ncbi:uncharacterized protein [Musca autumnalis]|uniref:uncharacterized protein n=1 Tax=Musca autumnalis TaxID=221902 RepID=UPI003CF22778
MNTLTIQCLIIGLSASAFCISLLSNHAYVWYKRTTLKDTPEKYVYSYYGKIVMDLAIYAAGALVCLLYIWGTLKKHHMALIPFLLCIIGAMGFTVVYIGYSMLWMDHGYFQLLMSCLPFIGMELLTFCTVCAMFKQIRRQNLATQKNRISTYYDKI